MEILLLVRLNLIKHGHSPWQTHHHRNSTSPLKGFLLSSVYIQVWKFVFSTNARVPHLMLFHSSLYCDKTVFIVTNVWLARALLWFITSFETSKFNCLLLINHLQRSCYTSIFYSVDVLAKSVFQTCMCR